MKLRILPILLLASAQPVPVRASDDNLRARAAVEAQQALPLAEILPGILERFDASLLEAEFESDRHGPVYEFELITGSGQMIEVKVDAATGEVIEIEGDRSEEGMED